MMPTAVTDVLANQNEYVAALGRLLGKGRKLDLFKAVYAGKSDRKLVADLAVQLGITQKAVLMAGKPLVDVHAIGQVGVHGQTAYAKMPAVKPIRDRILKVAGNPKLIDAIPTKQRPAPQSDLFRTSRAAPKLRAPRVAKGGPRWTIAMLVASPFGQEPIDVSLEAREVEIERRKALNGGSFALHFYPAANRESLVTALNDHAPDILHFSGHGAAGSIVLDNDTIRDIGGQSVKATTLARILSTATKRPQLLVLNACESAADASRFLQAVDIVIAMTEVVPDSTAFSYSRRLYSALFAGLSVAKAHEQACAVLTIDDEAGSKLPILLPADGVNPNDMRFA